MGSHESHQTMAHQSGIRPGKTAWILIAVGVAYYLWGWHKEHVLQYWPVAVFLLCPLMHLFMGHGHGAHGGGGHGGCHHTQNEKKQKE